MNRLRKWVEDRLGLSMFEEFGQKQLDKPVPAHSNYAFTLGTAALVVFATQVLSGILLAMNYSSGLEQAHVSVHKITFVLPAGWLLRSFHAWGSHLMVVILLLHMFRVFWYGGYKKPRELTWLFGCGLLFLMLGFGFTGYLLPMDQVSYWGTVVATESFMGLPGLGDKMGHVIRGSEEVTDATLSRFFIIHVLILPMAVAALVTIHLYLVRRLGISPRESVKEEEAKGYENIMRESGVPFAHHMYREVTTVLIVITLQVALAMLLPFGLGEVATPDATPKGVKPEWYFLPVYQLLKYFPKLVGILLINLAMAAFVLLPFLDRNPERRPGKRKFMMAVALVGLLVTLALGALGYVADRKIGGYEFDIRGVPHKAEEAAK